MPLNSAGNKRPVYPRVYGETTMPLNSREQQGPPVYPRVYGETTILDSP